MVKSIPLGLLAYGAAVTFAFLWASDAAYRATVSKALQRLADVGFGGTRITPGVHPLRWLHTIDENILKYIERGKQGSERVMVYSISRAAEPFLLIVGSALAIGLALYELAKYVKHQAGHAISRVEVHKITHTVTKVVGGVATITRVQFNHLTARVARLEHRVTHIARSAAGTIAQPFPRIGRLEKEAKAQAKRLTRLEKLLASGLGVALLVRALTKLGVNYIRCDRNKQLGKGICKTDTNWINEFLAGAVLLAGVESFHTFVEEAQAGFDLGLEGLQLFIKEFRELPIPKS